MTREEKISAIYKEMANKERGFGCKLQVIESVGPIQGVIFNIVSEGYKVLWDDKRITTETKISDLTVIGHPVMIGDVLDWIEPYGMGCAQSVEISNRRKRKIYLLMLQWDNKRIPIEDQSDECIDYVYSLIGNKNE